MDPGKQHLSCIDLYDMFPSHRGSYSRPRLHVAPLGFPLDTSVVLHEGLVSAVLRGTLCWKQDDQMNLFVRFTFVLQCFFLKTNILLDIDYETGDVRRFDIGTFFESATNRFSQNFRQQQGFHKMCSDFCHESEGMVLLYKRDGYVLSVNSV